MPVRAIFRPPHPSLSWTSMDISGNTRLIAHIGYPTQTFKAPLIYNPYFQSAGLDVVVVPFASQSDGYPALLRALFTAENVVGAGHHAAQGEHLRAAGAGIGHGTDCRGLQCGAARGRWPAGGGHVRR